MSHTSPKDKRIKYEKEEKAKISGFPTAKELRQAKDVAEARLKKEEEDAEQVGLVSIIGTVNVAPICISFSLTRNAN